MGAGRVGVAAASAEDEAFLEGVEPPVVPSGAPSWFELTSHEQLPSWAGGAIPKDFPLTKHTLVFLVKVKPAWLRVPRPDGTPAEPVLLLTELNLSDEDAARERARGRQHRLAGERAKQMIRAIDGQLPDRSGNPGPYALAEFWEFGLNAKGRDVLESFWYRTHAASAEDMADFLTSSLVIGKRGA